MCPDLIPATIASGLMPRDFARPGFGAVFGAMVRLGSERLFARPVSSVVDELHRAGDLGLAGGTGEIAGLLIDPLAAPLIPPAIDRVLMLARARRAQTLLRDALRQIERHPGDARRVLVSVGKAA